MAEKIELTEVEKAILWERMSGETLPSSERARILAGGNFVNPFLSKPLENENQPWNGEIFDAVERTESMTGPPEIEIINAIEECGENGIDPQILIDRLADGHHEMANVIEAIQFSIERGIISLNSQGMVVIVANA